MTYSKVERWWKRQGWQKKYLIVLSFIPMLCLLFALTLPLAVAFATKEVLDDAGNDSPTV